ncbi:cyclase [Saccharopolyspora griseoalba]|uniref:Cyclase n=1 Tax=Saccharopolyspora griseoalba TaxID=1431848 RepID=A0ABW2LL99_9PSEU
MKSVLGGKRAVTATALVAVAALAFTPQAMAATFDINFDCQGDSPLGAEQFSLQQTTDVTAPETVAPGAAFDIVVDPAVNTVPGEVNGNTVEEVRDFDLKIPVPANSTYVSADLEGGSNLGENPPTFTVDGGVATLHFDGPIAGGSEFELPTVTVHLTAGDSGAIESKLAGTSYDDPGLTFTAVVSSLVGDVDVPSACYPNPNPVLTTTTIS